MDGWLIADMSGILSMAWNILLVAIGLGLVIFVHELGHFVAAKACGVKCEKFYIGFDIPIRIGPIRLPTAFVRVRWGETEYGVGILPLGGYVKMLGQDDNPAAQARENERIWLRNQRPEATEGESTAGATGPGTPRGGAAEPASAREPSGPGGQADGNDDEPAGELDPRSYPAKPVWQRMIIISAGVVMNLISGMLFAAVAYHMGVSYTPCIVGGTAPGSPAWVAGLAPEDKILQIGRDGQPSEYLRFVKDLMPKVMLNGSDRAMDLLVRRHATGREAWFRIRPAESIRPTGTRSATLGVRPPTTTRLSRRLPADTYRFDDPAYDRFKGGDEIVAVDGRPLPRDDQTGAIFSYHLEAIFAQRMTEPITLSVVRRAARPEGGKADASSDGSVQRLDITLPPSKMRVLGLSMRPGPITGVRRGSPADKAGLRAGDRLVSIGGGEVGNPLTLAQRLLAQVGREIELVVQRAGADQPISVPVTLEPPMAYEDHFGPGSMISLEALGIALPIENVVQAVEPDSPAAKAGLRSGDRIVQVEFVVDDPEKQKQMERLFGKDYGKPIKLSAELPNWHYIHSTLQHAIPGTALRITYRRGDEQATVKVAPRYSDRWYHPARGLNWQQVTQIRTARSIAEACALGVREGKESLLQVLVVLKRLVTGKISPKSLGGPIMIAAAAGSEASEGIARLLIFLTFLSANLAVLNFLPIPALDGGHMVFLAAEGIRGKPVDERLQIALTWIGLLCLLTLMILVFALDIDRFFL